MSNICNVESDRKICPISNSVCPGVCVYSDVMANVSLGIIIFDIVNKRIEFQNNYAVDIFKDTIKEKDYHNLYSLLISDQNNIYTHKLPYIPKPIRYKNRILGHTTYKISESFILTLIRDITEKERLESIASAINIMNNFGYIFSGIRHEIGNPLNSIKMTISVLKNKLDDFSKENIVKYINRVQEEITRIEYLLRSLKNFNMHENPKMQKTNINNIIINFISLVETDLNKNNIAINYENGAGAIYGMTDPRALQQALLNLVTNSIDSLQKRENPEITLCIRKKRKCVTISVKDNGCGMTSDTKKDLFKPFITSKNDGTGLGLVIVQKMLAKMESTIQIESTENIGTTAVIQIPGNETD